MESQNQEPDFLAFWAGISQSALERMSKYPRVTPTMSELPELPSESLQRGPAEVPTWSAAQDHAIETPQIAEPSTIPVDTPSIPEPPEPSLTWPSLADQAPPHLETPSDLTAMEQALHVDTPQLSAEHESVVVMPEMPASTPSPAVDMPQLSHLEPVHVATPDVESHAPSLSIDVPSTSPQQTVVIDTPDDVSAAPPPQQVALPQLESPTQSIVVPELSPTSASMHQVETPSWSDTASAQPQIASLPPSSVETGVHKDIREPNLSWLSATAKSWLHSIEFDTQSRGIRWRP